MNSSKNAPKNAKPQEQPFPKLAPQPEIQVASGPVQILTIHLLAIIDILTGRLFMDALPLVGGEEAKEELQSWKIGVESGNEDVFTEKKKLSTYTTLALGAYSMGASISQHITKSQADAIKAIFEIASMYDQYSSELYELKKTVKSKDLTPQEKLDALWTVLDVIYEERKQSFNLNAKNDPESLKKLVDDLNMMFISLDKLSQGAKMIQIIPPSSSSNI